MWESGRFINGFFTSLSEEVKMCDQNDDFIVAYPNVVHSLIDLKFEPITIKEFKKYGMTFCLKIENINEVNQWSIYDKIEFYIKALNKDSLYLVLNDKCLCLSYTYYHKEPVFAKRPISMKELKTIKLTDFESTDVNYLLKKYFGVKDEFIIL